MLNLVEQSDLDEIKAKLADLVANYEFLKQRYNTLERRIATLEFPGRTYGPISPEPYQPIWHGPYVQPNYQPNVWCETTSVPKD